MLNFLKTMELDSFKEGLGAADIEIKLNNKTGKIFFSCGTKTGAVSSVCASNEFKDPVVSEVLSEDTGEVFYMLHSRGEGGASCLARL